jgi:carbon storage regulator CsrA
MLVLQRKVGEQIRIGTDIVVTVIRTACGRVSLGIQAPPHCTIRRSELLSFFGPSSANGLPQA